MNPARPPHPHFPGGRALHAPRPLTQEVVSGIHPSPCAKRAGLNLKPQEIAMRRPTLFNMAVFVLVYLLVVVGVVAIGYALLT
jgi:hypothetical protein